MAATFVNVTKEILKVLVYYFLSINHLSNYNKTIIEYYWIVQLYFVHLRGIIVKQKTLFQLIETKRRLSTGTASLTGLGTEVSQY